MSLKKDSFTLSRRQLNDLYESLFDNMFDGLAYCKIICDEQGRPVDYVFLKINRNFEKLTGLKNVIGKTVRSIVPGLRTTNSDVFEIYGRVASTGKPESFETYVPSLKRWFYVSAYSPMKGFFVSVFQNTTEHKRIEMELNNARIAARNVMEDLQVETESLAEAKAKDEAMLDSIGDGLVSTDIKGRIVLVNSVFERILGWKKEEMYGKLSSEMVQMLDKSGAVVQKKESLIDQCIAERTQVSAIAYYKRKDGSLLPVAITISPVLSGEEFLGVIEVFRDISKEIEIDRAKSEFVSLASHQLKTPLTTIGWYAEMLMRKNEVYSTEKGYVYAEKILSNNQRMIELVNTLLNVSRIDMGTLMIRPAPIDVVEIAKSVIEDLRLYIRGKHLRMIRDFPTESFMVVADPQLIRMIFENIFSNAMKYSHDNGTVIVKIQKQSRNWQIEVTDEGCGIPKKQQGQIFTKLFRADNAKEINSEGTGLGLYIVKSIVEKSAGKIRFVSEENKGTSFFITLPLKQKEVHVDAAVSV